jgi:hypothetical protein
MGRPPSDSVRKVIVMPAKMAWAVEAYRKKESRFASEAEVIRYLIAAGLDAEKKKKKAAAPSS